MEIEYGWNRLKAAIKNLAYQFRHNNNVQKEKTQRLKIKKIFLYFCWFSIFFFVIFGFINDLNKQKTRKSPIPTLKT